MIKVFKSLQEKYSHKQFLSKDPISLVYNYSSDKDREVVGLIVSLYSYGNVTAILNFLRPLLSLLGDNPSEELLNDDFDASRFRVSLTVYRFQKIDDHIIFLNALSKILKKRKSVFPYFEEDFLGDSLTGEDLLMGKGILNFQNTIRKEFSNSTYGLDFLVGKAKSESSHKRYSMFLRWMVGKNFPDFGIYSRYPENNLVFPLDTHIQKIIDILDMKTGKTPNRKMAVAFTKELSELLNEPSVRYDFALSRLGIQEKCKAKFLKEICTTCELRSVCKYFPKYS